VRGQKISGRVNETARPIHSRCTVVLFSYDENEEKKIKDLMSGKSRRDKPDAIAKNGWRRPFCEKEVYLCRALLRKRLHNLARWPRPGGQDLFEKKKSMYAGLLCKRSLCLQGSFAKETLQSSEISCERNSILRKSLAQTTIPVKMKSIFVGLFCKRDFTI